MGVMSSAKLFLITFQLFAPQQMEQQASVCRTVSAATTIKAMLPLAMPMQWLIVFADDAFSLVAIIKRTAY